MFIIHNTVRHKSTFLRAVRMPEDPEGQEVVADLCKGPIKGTSLPPKDRVINFYDNLDHEGGREVRISVGDWVVVHPCGWVQGLSDELFNLLYTI